MTTETEIECPYDRTPAAIKLGLEQAAERAKQTEIADIASSLKYCDICGRSEIDQMIEPHGELLNIEWSPDDGCMVCDECIQPITPVDQPVDILNEF